MDAEGRRPAWVDPSTPMRPWLDVRLAFPKIKPRPYLIHSNVGAGVRSALEAIGFAVVEAFPAVETEDPEDAFLKELTRRLGFDELGAGSWAAFNDRLWDFLRSSDSTPFAVVIYGLDSLFDVDVYRFVRCIHNLLSLTEGAGLTDSVANRQIEYFFVGEWRGVSVGR